MFHSATKNKFGRAEPRGNSANGRELEKLVIVFDSVDILEGNKVYLQKEIAYSK